MTAVNRAEALQALRARLTDELVVAELGNPAYDLFNAGDRPEHFYLWGGMGLGPSIALGVALAALFVLARNAITFVNSSSYPFFVLGGVLVPASFLPDWLEPLSSAVFLSWSADLLRSTLSPKPIDAFASRVGMVLALGAAGLVVGAVAMTYFLTKVRSRGDLGFQ